MGNPLVPSLANLFFGELGKKYLGQRTHIRGREGKMGIVRKEVTLKCTIFLPRMMKFAVRILKNIQINILSCQASIAYIYLTILLRRGIIMPVVSPPPSYPPGWIRWGGHLMLTV